MGKRLDADAFGSTIEGLNIGERPIAMARAVLVDGRSQSGVARDQGVSRNAVCLAVNRIWEAHQDVPAGFERVNAVLPKQKAAIVRQWLGLAPQKTEATR